MSDNKAFDLEAVYDQEIAPLMSKIIDICKANKLPMFATFFYKSGGDEDGDGFCSTNLYFDERPESRRLAQLCPIMLGETGPAMRMRLTRGDGSIEDIVVIP